VDAVTTVLAVQKIRKIFGGTVALTDLDIHLRHGEILGLIGPNGAGKTTLINIVSGHLRPETGEVRLHDRVITSLPAHEIARTGIARTFQTARLFMGMTVEENVRVGAFFGAARLGKDRDTHKRVDDALAFLSLTSRRHDRVEALTIVERKRVELARALAMEPQVLLLDELMAGLNASEMDGTIALVREINRLGVSLIIVEHVMEAVVGLCERVIVLHHGQKIADGPTRTVLDDSRVIDVYLGSRYRDRLRPAATKS
jgi:branched-chain amino acid transport system ATP-binding protein